jgi:hypothetical protein
MEQLRKMLVKQGIAYTSYTKWSDHFRLKWRHAFASHLSEEEQHAIYMLPTKKGGHYLWHLFSYEKRPALIGDSAIQAFNEKEKTTCIIFSEMADEVFMLENARELRAELLPERDFYIVDEHFTWSYNHTHEMPYLGPYYTDSKIGGILKNEHHD